MDGVYYRGYLFKGVYFIVDMFYRGFLEGLYVWQAGKSNIKSHFEFPR